MEREGDVGLKGWNGLERLCRSLLDTEGLSFKIALPLLKDVISYTDFKPV